MFFIVYRDGLFIKNKTRLKELCRELDNTAHDTPPPKYNIDSKTVKDPEVQRKFCATIKSYLRDTNYDGVEPATSRTISSPQFQAVFKYLISRIMPKFVFRKKFEDDVMDILRDLKCPVLNMFTTTTLRSIGTLHTHPSLFALLFWLTECNKQLEFTRLTIEKQSNKQDPSQLFQDFTIECYRSHKLGDDDFTEQTNKLRENCGKTDQ